VLTMLPAPGRSSGSTHWGSVAVICDSSGREAAFGRDQRRLSCRGTALVNPVGELVRLATALARIRTAVAFAGSRPVWRWAELGHAVR
jgi:hypothetical protein